MLRCPECGTPYKQITGGNKQYCSERCRKHAERKRWKAKRKKFEQMSLAEQKQIKDKNEKALLEKSHREEAKKAASEKKREDARLKREAKKRLKKEQTTERKAKKRAERIQAKEKALHAEETNKNLSWEEKVERLAEARRLRDEKRKQTMEWRLKHKAETYKIEQSRKKRALETRQRVAAMQRERSRNKYREMRKPIIAERVKKGWILCKGVCKECGEEFEYAKQTKDVRDSIFCSPTCNSSYRWKHGKKHKYQMKAQQIARLAKQEFPGSKWERVLNPNNRVDRIFIYGY